MRGTHKAHDGRNHRVALLATCLIGFSLLLNLYYTQIVLEPIAKAFGATVLEARYTVVAATAGAVFAPLLASRLRQKKSVQVAILAALTLCAGTEAAAPYLWILVAARFCQGVLVGLLFIESMGRIATLHRPRFGSLSNSLFVFSTTLGGFASRFLPARLVDEIGLKATFLVLAAMMLSICGAVLFLPAPEPDSAGLERIPAAAPASAQRRAFAVEYLLGFCILFSQVSIFTYLPVRLADAPFSLSNAQIAYTAFVFLPGAASASLTHRVTADDLSRSAISLFFGCVAIGALMTGSSSLYGVGAGLVIFAVGVFALQAMLSRRLTARAGRATPRIFAAYMAVYYLGGSAGSYICGTVAAADGFSGVVVVVLWVTALGAIALHGQEAWRRATAREGTRIVQPPF